MGAVEAEEHAADEGNGAGGAASEAAEQFQRAALEAVRAARAMLDAAETVIRDPASLESVIRAAAGVARTATQTVADFAAAAGAGGASRRAASDGDAPHDPDDDDGQGGGYESIPVG